MRQLWILVPTAVIVTGGLFIQRQVGDAAWGAVTAELGGLFWLWYRYYLKQTRRSCRKPSA